jgi:ubiquinone/menaquinone biosynthesis C-methylase UbiE
MGNHQRWQVAGTAAEIYQRELEPAVFGPWAPRVVELADLRPGMSVLDVACGAGVVARVAAEAVGEDGRVTGLDLNPGMLAVAARLPDVRGAAIKWVEGSAQSLPFADASYEVVCCQLGLQYFPDRKAALSEMHRVLVRGGRLVVMVWREIDRAPGFAALATALGLRISSDAEALMRAPFGLSEAAELSGLLEEAGFSDVSVHAVIGNVRFASPAIFVQSYVGCSPLAGMVSAAPESAYQDLVRDVEVKLEPFTQREGMAFPIEAHLALARP